MALGLVTGLSAAARAADLLLQVAGNRHILNKGDIRRAAAILRETGYVVTISLGKDTAKLVCTLTTQNIGKTMKVLIAGKPVIDAVITSPICNGELAISGAFSKKEAEKVARDLKPAT